MDQHPLVVTVDRHHVLRAREVEHHFDLLRVAVAGGVDRRVAGGHDLAADVVEPVDRLVDGALVAGDRRRAEHDRVPRPEFDLRMIAIRHPAQRRRGSPWEPVEMTTIFSSGPLVDLARRQQHPLRDVDVAERRPMLTFLRIERPTSATLRAFFSACTTCWTRWMFDAKQVTTIRPSQRRTRGRGAGRRSIRSQRSPAGRRSSSRPAAAGRLRGRVRPAAPCRRAGRPPASGRTCSRR